MIVEQQQYHDLFFALAEQWAEIKARREQACVKGDLQKVAHWQDQLTKMQRQQQTSRQMGLWIAGPRNLLSVIGRARHEIFHTTILAWLLDPSAPHGLGTTFLSRFLARCLPDEPQLYPSHSLSAARTATEVIGSTSRADVVVTSPKVVLVVEAKIDSVESDLQCERLYNDFVEYVTGTETRFAFLTPLGRPPTSEGQDAVGQFRRISLRDLKDDLAIAVGQRAVGKIGTTTVSGFVAVIDYLSVLEDEF